MSFWSTFSGENLRSQWGEYLPMPAQKRLWTINRAVGHVANSIQVQESNMVRSQHKAAQEVDNLLMSATSSPTSRNVFSKAIGGHNTVNPAINSTASKNSIPNVNLNRQSDAERTLLADSVSSTSTSPTQAIVSDHVNAQHLQEAYEKLAAIHGEEVNA